MIKLENIRKVYVNGGNETVALQDIDLEIRSGEFVAIMGPSGSGKSTLMHILGALDTPTSGRYRLDGKDVSRLTDDELSDMRLNKIGFVFQSFNLLPRTDVLKNVALPLVYQGVARKERESRVRKVLEAVNITAERWGHLSNQLSGGQIQRVAIARALVNDPSLILADEPTGNLDTKTGMQVMKTFQELNDQSGHTIILITHEQEVAHYADRIIFIRDGRIVEDQRNGRRIIS